MPTIAQLPTASTAGAQDELPISQSGITRAVTVAELLSGTQAAIEIASPSVLGRASLGPGGPEALSVGLGLVVANASLAADGADHASFALENSFSTGDQAIINSNGTPTRLPLTALRALFSAGNNVSISSNGTIASTTDPSVTASLTTLTQSVSAADASVAALNAKIPSGGFAALNGSGQVTSPVAADVSQATVTAGTGGVARTLAARSLDEVNVLDFGAQPGGADCTAAFNAAFNQLSSDGGTMFIPAGEYWLASPLVFSGKALEIRGAGKGQTKIHFQHTGIGFDFAPGNIYSRVILREFSVLAENASGQTAAAARITFPVVSSFGYITCFISDIEVFSYPNGVNGASPFPQTFLRGFVLNNCWSTQVNNVSWFGPPAAAGATSSALVEVNNTFDTRLAGVRAYSGNAVVLQTGYCEGIYFSNPLVVGVDYLFTQTNQTTWPGYVANKAMLLGLWAANGEINTNLGTVNIQNVTDGFFVGLDITRDSGPTTPESLFNCTNVSNFHVADCNFVGGPGNADVAFSFSSTWDSSSNIIQGCHFEDMATVIQINGSNGTVGLTAYGLHLGNVPPATAIIDNTPDSVSNFVSFISPATSSIPAGIGCSKDHVLAGLNGSVLFRVTNIGGAVNYVRNQPATTSNAPALCFDGSDTVVGGSIQTKGGNLIMTASGGSGFNGDLLDLISTTNATNWVVIQNATAGNLSQITTNSGGVSLQPKGELLLAPSGGLFASNLPTTRPPAGSGQVWNNGGVLSIA
jgi:hypothetical protein